MVKIFIIFVFLELALFGCLWEDEAAMDIKTIILDLDGTVLRSDKSVSNQTISVLKRCRKKGILVAVATARSEKAAARYLDQLKPDAVISNGGALVRLGGLTIYESVMPAGTADALISELTQLPGYVEVTAETSSGYFVSYSTPSYGDYTHSVYHGFSKPLEQDVYKITVHLSKEDGLNEVVEKYPECGLVPFSDGVWYRFAGKHATKMNGIHRLADHCGFAISTVAAFGDDYNDEEMIRKCGVGIAMDNAIDSVKAAADHVCESNDNDGVAKWLEAYLFRG